MSGLRRATTAGRAGSGTSSSARRPRRRRCVGVLKGQSRIIRRVSLFMRRSSFVGLGEEDTSEGLSRLFLFSS